MTTLLSRLGKAAWLIVALPLIACDEDRMPAALETAILQGSWERVETLGAAMPRLAGSRSDLAVLRGYAALARADSAAASRHFHSLRPGDAGSGEFAWILGLAARHPEHPAGDLLAGFALARRGDREGVVKLTRVLSRQPDSPLARVTLGLALAAEGRRAEALVHLDRARSDPATEAEAAIGRSLVRLGESQPGAAADEIAGVSPQSRSHALVFNTLGAIAAGEADWAAAARDFETAFRLMPELSEARENWHLARASAAQRGTAITQTRHLAIFGTGIRSEGEVDYALNHAKHLLPPGQSATMYVGVKGTLPLRGIETAADRGYRTVVIDPRDPESGMRQIDRFIDATLTAGKNPVLLVDMNKWVPSQLLNLKGTALDLPAQIIERSNDHFKSAAAAGGFKGVTTVGAHSDFTYPAVLGTISSAKSRPVDRLFLESPRSEQYVREVVGRSPGTQVTLTQSADGDLWTLEAQGRTLRLEPGAYRSTIDAFKNIESPNYRLVLINNPSRGRFGIPASHGDAANYERHSEVSIYSGGRKVGDHVGKLGEILGRPNLSSPLPYSQPTARGGVYLATARPVEGVRLVYPLFGCVACPGRGR